MCTNQDKTIEQNIVHCSYIKHVWQQITGLTYVFLYKYTNSWQAQLPLSIAPKHRHKNKIQPNYKPWRNQSNPILVHFLLSSSDCDSRLFSSMLGYLFPLQCFCFHSSHIVPLIFGSLSLSCQSRKPFPHNLGCCTATRAWALVQPPKELISLIGVLQQNSYHINDNEIRQIQKFTYKIVRRANNFDTYQRPMLTSIKPPLEITGR